MRLIADGTVDREGVSGLAARLGYTTRQLERLLQAEVGAEPLALARAQRAQTARVLIETTELPFGDVAFAAGFSSIRQFNDTVRLVCENTPTALRKRAAVRFGSRVRASPGRCPCGCRYARRSPTRACSVIWRPVRCPAARKSATAHTGALCDFPSGSGVVSLTPASTTSAACWCSTTSAISPRRSPAAGGCWTSTPTPRRWSTRSRRDPDLAPVVAKAPGQRIPRTVDEAELAVRAVLGQQVSTKAARTHAGRLVAAYGQPVQDLVGAIDPHLPVGRAACRARSRPSRRPQGPATNIDRAGRRACRRQRRPGCRDPTGKARAGNCWPSRASAPGQRR